VKTDSCVFCDIINRTTEASIVYEDELVMAFHDAYPLNPGHTLVVPKAHARDISELDQLTLWSMVRVAQEIACVMPSVSGIGCTGVNIVMANGHSAGQEVMHAHLHVLPRTDSDGIRFSGPNSPKKMKRDHMNVHAQNIADKLRKHFFSRGMHSMHG
jgi:histidine triad (HIT) family protein